MTAWGLPDKYFVHILSNIAIYKLRNPILGFAIFFVVFLRIGVQMNSHYTAKFVQIVDRKVAVSRQEIQYL
jgi:hypothetical protein